MEKGNRGFLGKQFPFLIGTVRTHWKQRRRGKHEVSIPHRYGKNYYTTNFRSCKLTFPFLIGTVRTFCICCFLVSVYYVSIPHRYGKNQILKILMNCLMQVSIPHRYGKNFVDRFFSIRRNAVSIPHRYGKNLFPVRFRAYLTKFPFLIGTVRTH